MPSPNADFPSAKNTLDKQNAAHFGSKLAKRKSLDFTSKIQGWDLAGAADNQRPDEVVVVGDAGQEQSNNGDTLDFTTFGDPSRPPASPKSPVIGLKTAPSNMLPNAKAREVDLSRKAWVRKKSKPPVEISEEVKQATTPKKRVVSDGHWRRDRTIVKLDSPEKESGEDAIPKPVIIRRSVVSVGLKVPPSTQDFVEVERDLEPLKVKPLKPSRSRSRSPLQENGGTPDYEDSGVKVYIKRRRPSRVAPKGVSTSGSSQTLGSSVDRPSSATDITTPTRSLQKEIRPRSSTAPRQRPSGSLSGPEDETWRPSTTRRKSRTPMTDDEDRKISKPASTPVIKPGPQVFGTRIEGWLADMPEDPFTESRKSLTPESLTIPKRKIRTGASDEEAQARHGDEIDRRRRSSTTRHRSKPNLEPNDTERRGSHQIGRHSVSPLPNASDTSATPNLKRSGARRASHSPIKERESRALSLDHTLPSPTQRNGIPTRISGERPLISAGKRLSTFGSLETVHSRPMLQRRAPSDVSEKPTVAPEGSILSRASDGDDRGRDGSGLKRRLTKHSDLISVLSLAPSDDLGLIPARSIRKRRIRDQSMTIGDIMNEITVDELKYQRELRTLVDGVIPVLLTYVLQKTDPSGSKRLFSGSSNEGQAITRPIVEMGVALERLKATHKRIPMHKPEDLLQWATGAEKAYTNYLRAWRLGFSDVVVNLAPAEGTPKGSGWDAGPSKSNDDGERADVAYLLKRPLVRLKYLAKTFRGIDQVSPSAKAAEMAVKYHELVTEARQRANEERGRLEDEGAAAIDPTRAREPHSLAPILGVTIDRTRSVRARDYFDLDLLHSSGQQLGCKIEIIIRDDALDRGTSGDILFCEVSPVGRWLLFPPVLASHVSARVGDRLGEMIVMIRGFNSIGREWREVLSLQSTDEGAVEEWLGMLSSTPVPSRLSKKSSFNMRNSSTMRTHSAAAGDSPDRDRTSSLREIEVPIGEQAEWTSKKWDGSEVNSVVDDEPLGSLHSARAKRYQSMPSSPITEESYEQVHAKYFSEQDRQEAISSRSRYHNRPTPSHHRSVPEWSTKSGVSTAKKEYSVWLPLTDGGSDESSAGEEDKPAPQRPSKHQRASSVPSADLPIIPKIRNSNRPTTPRKTHEPARAESMPNPGGLEPMSAPAKLQKPTEPKHATQVTSSAQVKSAPLGIRSSLIPSFTPAFLKKHRRSSSPLKHEYAPSSGSESLSESDLSDNDDVESITSESSAEDEGISTVGTLKDFQKFGMRPRQMRPISQPLPPTPKSPISSPDNTLSPSESASQAPYRTVPPTNAEPARTVAQIFAWADRGSWDSLHPEECCIVVTPGLIEAFDLAQALAVAPGPEGGPDTSPSARGVRPLVALELTPLVPLRRGTALDISIRSPPTDRSVLRTGNNVMFRSRNAEECERLYNLINRARIDNPTYIALQHARGPAKTSNWAEVMDQRNDARVTSSGSWWNMGSRKSSTYRSKGTRAASTAATDSSVGSTFSALRRFSSGSRIFNIAKSRVASREGTRSSYSDSLDSGVATPIPMDASGGTPLGTANAKIRLYVRESAGQWRDMGAARLTVMMPPRPDPTMPRPKTLTGQEKRIFVCGKSKGEILLDVLLGENCFERIARTGIAVSVYEENIGPNGEVGHIGAVGGVAGARTRIYMLQMKSVSCGLSISFLIECTH